MVKMGALCICENRLNGPNGKPILVGFLAGIELINIPSMYSFSIVNSILYMRRDQKYNFTISVSYEENDKEHEIFKRTIDQFSLPKKDKEEAHLVLTFNIKNLAFYHEGNYKIKTRIVNANNDLDNSSAEIDVPVLVNHNLTKNQQDNKQSNKEE